VFHEKPVWLGNISCSIHPAIAPVEAFIR
jgi:hypothetical protein